MADDRVAALLAEVGLPPTASDRARIEGHDPVLPTAFPIGEAAAVALAACGAAVASLWEDRTGEDQSVTVDVRRAAASLIGFAFQRLDGGPTRRPAEGHPLVALYEGRDGRWIHLHGAFPRLAERTQAVLGGGLDDGASVAAAVKKWDACVLEDALAEAGTCGAMVRTVDEWRAHPQAEAIAPLGRVDVVKVGESDPIPVGDVDGRRPLGGVRVLDLTRVLAGPTHGRVLAEHGADVLLVNSPALPNVEPFVLDTSHGKRSTLLDLDRHADEQRLRELVGEADVFCQGYRGGALERRGFGADELIAARPGLVHVTINCYGDVGPWRERPGWEQLAQSVTGIAAAHGGGPSSPALLPAAACDYTTGYLAALGTLAALRRRSQEGGSYQVRVSLAGTGRWLTDLEAVPDAGAATGPGDVEPWMTESVRTDGTTLRHLAPVVQLSATPARRDRPSPPLGADLAEWLPLP
jgi:crotonobetainyl-CoA:carnitine CoA-transferase CaiB-like acyl-CoA transferase